MFFTDLCLESAFTSTTSDNVLIYFYYKSNCAHCSFILVISARYNSYPEESLFWSPQLYDVSLFSLLSQNILTMPTTDSIGFLSSSNDTCCCCSKSVNQQKLTKINFKFMSRNPFAYHPINETIERARCRFLFRKKKMFK